MRAFSASRDAYDKVTAHKVRDHTRAADLNQQMLDEYRNLTGIDGRGSTSPGVTTRRNVLRDLERAKRLEDGNPEPPAEISPSPWPGRGSARNVDEAETETRNALNSRPDDGQAHNLAVTYMRTDRFPEARAAVEKAEKSGFAVNPKLKEERECRAPAQ